MQGWPLANVAEHTGMLERKKERNEGGLGDPFKNDNPALQFFPNMRTKSCFFRKILNSIENSIEKS